MLFYILFQKSKNNKNDKKKNNMKKHLISYLLQFLEKKKSFT